jgi:hypothetical protein
MLLDTELSCCWRGLFVYQLECAAVTVPCFAGVSGRP